MPRARVGPQYRHAHTRTVLTPRQLEVAGYLSQGLPTADIAELMHVSFHTVKQHIAAIIERTHSRSRTHAVATLLREGDLD